MAKIYFSETELDALHQKAGQVMPPVAYSLRAPMPQLFLVTTDRKQSVCVRTTTLNPLSWIPYTKSVNIPLDDTKVVDNLRRPEAQCVLALPTKDQLRQLTICSQQLPQGISEASVARFNLCKSLYIDTPSIDDCPVNLECVVDHLEEYYTHLIAFMRVVGASINDAMLFREREEIVSIYPTNFADKIRDEHGWIRNRVSMISELYLCPTFPVAPKQGWYSDFDQWLKDLLEEEYLHQDEYEQVVAWHKRWQELFLDLNSPERAQVRTNLTEFTNLIARERWQEVHTFLKSQ